MNWKLVFQLSLLGLIMAIGTVFVIPPNIEPLLWLVAFLASAYLIAVRAPGRYFLHGLCVGLANCVWVTGFHVLFFSRYVAGHPREAAMMSSMQHPRWMMLAVGPVVGVISGCVIGILAIIAAKLMTRSAPAPVAP